MVQDAEGRGLYFPIRLRCAAVADALTNPELEDALARALGRAFAHARTALPAAVVVGDGVVLQPPQLMKGDLSTNDATALLARVSCAIEAATRAQSVPLSKSPLAHTQIQAIDVSEPFDPQRFDPTTATYDIPSYSGGRRKVPVRETSNPFKRIQQLADAYYEALSRLLDDIGRLKAPNQRRLGLQSQLARQSPGVKLSVERVHVAVEVIAGKPVKDLSPLETALYKSFVPFYTVNKVYPAPERIVAQEKILERNLLLLTIVRQRVNNLDQQANLIIETMELTHLFARNYQPPPTPTTDQDVRRQTIIDLGSHYLELLLLLEEAGQKQKSTRTTIEKDIEIVNTTLQEVFSRLAFLDTFYSDPQRLNLYAVLRFGRMQLEDMVKNLAQISTTMTMGPIFDPQGERRAGYIDEAVPRISRQQARHANTMADAINWVQDIRHFIASLGDLPKVQQEVHVVPSPRSVSVLSALLIHVQILIAVLDLWRSFDSLQEMLAADPYVGIPLFGTQSRERWLREIRDLGDAFYAEAHTFPHVDIEKRVTDWEQRVNRLQSEIPPAARARIIVAGVIQEILFLFVGGKVIKGVGVFVRAVTNGSRWIAILAEGATLTLFSAVTAAPGTRPTTILGWAGQFTVNVALASIGQLFSAFRGGTDFVEQLATSRRLLLQIGLRTGGALVTTTVVQTTIQALEASAKEQGGESSFTLMLTANFALNLLGVLLGAATDIESTPPSGTLVKNDPAELVRVIKRARQVVITEEAARQWLELKQQAGNFEARLQQLSELASKGRLSPEEFNTLKKQGLELAKDLKEKMPALADALGTGQSPEELRTLAEGLYTFIDSLPFPRPGLPSVLALPPFISGLKQLGMGNTWIYDPSNEPSGLKNLLDNYQRRGYRVRELKLPGGGWEVFNLQGQILLQIIPASPELTRALPPSLDAIATGTQAREGLNRVRAQSFAPELESHFAQAAVQSGTSVVTRLLRITGNFVVPSNAAAWRGFSKYLKLGGDPEVLARALTFRQSRVMAGENQAHVNLVLSQLAEWDASAVRGLSALYRVRPRTITDSAFRGGMESLFGNFQTEPEILRGIFQSIDLLAPRSRGLGRLITSLMSNNPADQQGAVGQLTRGVELAQRHPDKLIAFEREVEESVPGKNITIVRRQDIAIIGQETITINDLQYTIETPVIVEEIKTISGRLSSDAPNELARDIILDSLARTRLAAQRGEPQPLFKTFRWLIRSRELRSIATERLNRRGIAAPDLRAVDQEMRAIIKDQLRPAFKQPILLKSLDGAEIQNYQNAFEQDLKFFDFSETL